jgi:hypothetical protein
LCHGWLSFPLILVIAIAGQPYTARPAELLATETKLIASGAAGYDLFGSSVAISGDTVVVGAPEDDTSSGINAGSAYVFVRNETGWREQAALQAGDGTLGDFFGTSVAISGDTIVVGAYGDDGAYAFSGSAYVFVRSGTNWIQQARLIGDPAQEQEAQFGGSVAVSGDTIVVGAHLEDGTYADSGAAYVFVRSGPNWIQQARLTANDAAPRVWFGSSVAIDGETIVVGTPLDGNGSSGSAYIFARDRTNWNQQAKLTTSAAAAGDHFGTSVSVSEDTVVIGAPSYVLVGAPPRGWAYVFTRRGTNWTQQQQLAANDAAPGDNFGSSVAISGDTLVVGAAFDDTSAGADAGSGYVFVWNGTSWIQQQRLFARDAAGGDECGWSVGIGGGTVVAGARLADTTAGVNTGAAYVYEPGSAPMVTVAPTDASAAEEGLDPGVFTITRTGGTATPLTVLYTLSGTASNGVDYEILPGSVTVPAGETSATITVTPIDDGETEGSETVVLTLRADAAYTIGSPGSATANIADNDSPPPSDAPRVQVVASDYLAKFSALDEQYGGTRPNPGEFVFWRNGDTTTALSVFYALSGTATNGVDYETLSGLTTFPVGVSYTTVTVTPINDAYKSVVLTLSPDAAYIVGSMSSATVRMVSSWYLPDASWYVRVYVTKETASESGPEPGEFIITRAQADYGTSNSSVTVNYKLSGSAVNGEDYAALSGSVTIPPGASFAPVTVTPIDDNIYGGTRTAVLTLSYSPSCDVASPPGTATVTIKDNDPPAATRPALTVVATDANASENGPDPGKFTISRYGDVTLALTVYYTLGGTASNGVDYETLPGSVTIPAGASSVDVVVQPIDDTETDSSLNEFVKLTLATNAAYRFGSPSNSASLSSDVVWIYDNDWPLVTVVTTDANASESGPDPGKFTIHRSRGTNEPLTVYFTLEGSASNGIDYQPLGNSVTIPAGASSFDLTVLPIDDTNVEGSESVLLVLAHNPNYFIAAPSDASLGIADNDQPPPGPPTVTVTAVTASQIDLTWNDPTTDEEGFEIERSTDNLNFAQIATVSANVTNYSNTGLKASTTYYYRVRASHGNGDSAYSNSASATTESVGLATPWQSQDIGPVGATGGASFDGGTFRVTGSGEDVWGQVDAFHFVHRKWASDGIIVARVTSVQNTDPWAKAGVMFRQSLDPASPYAFMMLTPQNGPGFQSRRNAAANSTYAPGPWVTAPHWLKLARSGDTFIGYTSSDGVRWVFVGSQTIPMSGPIVVGLAVTAHNNSALNTSTFANVMLDAPLLSGTPPAEQVTGPSPGLRLVGRDGNGAIQLVVEGEPGRTYAVETSGDLVNWTPFVNRFSASGTVSIPDTTAANHFERFYRAVVAPQDAF